MINLQILLNTVGLSVWRVSLSMRWHIHLSGIKNFNSICKFVMEVFQHIYILILIAGHFSIAILYAGNFHKSIGTYRFFNVSWWNYRIALNLFSANYYTTVTLGRKYYSMPNIMVLLCNNLQTPSGYGTQYLVSIISKKYRHVRILF